MALRAALAGQAALLGAGFAGYTWYNRKPARKATAKTPLTAERVAGAARDIVGSARGLGINIHTTAKTDEEGALLLSALRFPFEPQRTK